MKKRDIEKELSEKELNKRGRYVLDHTSRKSKEPIYGQEFFFSNILVKIVQIPMLMSRSNEEEMNPSEAAFIVMIYEKLMRKRYIPKNALQLLRLKSNNKG